MKGLFTFFTLIILVSCDNSHDKKEIVSTIETTKSDTLTIPDTSFKTFIDSIKPPVQRFTIKNDKECFLKCKKGTVVYFPSNCFETDSKDSISVQITEYISKQDMYFGDLTTHSDGKIIESGGMAFVECFVKNKKIALKENAKAAIAFPKNKFEDGKLFYGEQTETSEINWKIQNSKEDEVIVQKQKGSKINNKVNPEDYKYGMGGLREIEGFDFFWNYKGKKMGMGEMVRLRYNFPPKLLEYLKENIHNTSFSFNFDIDTLTGKVINVKATPQNKENKYSKDFINVLKSLPPATIVHEKRDKTENYSISKDKFEKIHNIFIVELSSKLVNEIQKQEVIKQQAELKKQLEENVKKNDIYFSSYSETVFENYSSSEMESFNKFAFSKLGWINCDKFRNNQEITTITLPIYLEKGVEGKLIFKDFNSIVQATNSLNNGLSFFGIPVGQNVILIITKDKNNSKIILAKEFKVSKEALDIKELAPISLAELKKMI
jgi:hypothetical protein